MILTFDQLADIRHRVTLVDGSFDPIHDGHVEYFTRAAALGNPILCNIAPDEWTVQKHPVLLPQEARARVIDAFRQIDFVHCASRSTAEIIDQVRPVNFVKGRDWEIRGGIPEAESVVCRKHGTKVVYLDSVLNSSTRLLSEYSKGLSK